MRRGGLVGSSGDFGPLLRFRGNHDFGAESDPGGCRALFESCGITWLVDDAAVVDGVTFYGSPWQPRFLDWAFNVQRYDGGVAARAAWSKIPDDVDVLVTHGPPCAGERRMLVRSSRRCVFPKSWCERARRRRPVS